MAVTGNAGKKDHAKDTSDGVFLSWSFCVQKQADERSFLWITKTRIWLTPISSRQYDFFHKEAKALLKAGPHPNESDACTGA